MVKKFIFVVILALLSPASAWAANFTASVDSTAVTVGQPFTLQLWLTGADAKESPDLSELKISFAIVGQARTSSYNYFNGSSSSNIGLQISLAAKRVGRLTIPALSIETSAGILSTQPITIDAQRGSASPPIVTGNDNSPIIITATADPKDPYQGQPVRYQILVTCTASVANLILDDISVENAIFDKPKQPKIFDVTQNGVAAKMLEYDFVVTPMKPGLLTIPPPKFHGTVMGSVQMPDPLSNGFGSFLNMFQNMMARPFDLAGPAVYINVKSPAVEMHPWLPLYSLQIQDEWKSVNDAKTGEPITRKITMLAEGVAGNQLPNLDSRQNRADFKFYADKADIGTNNGKPGERVVGWRHENYTLIPQKPGTFTIPAIRVPWWNIGTNRIDYADLPEKTITVSAGTLPTSPAPAPAVAPLQTDEASSPLPQTETPSTIFGVRLLYIVLGILVLVLLPIVLWALSMQRKIMHLQQAAKAKPTPASAAKKVPSAGSEELKRVQTPDELLRYLQAFAAKQWGTSVNAPLEKILSAAPTVVKGELKTVVNALKLSLYAGQPVQIEQLKQHVATICAWKPQKMSEKKSGEKLRDLNP